MIIAVSQPAVTWRLRLELLTQPAYSSFLHSD